MKVSIEKQADGTYIAYNASGDNVRLIGIGDTVREAKEDFFNSLNEIMDTYAEIGDEAPSFLSEEIDFRCVLSD